MQTDETYIVIDVSKNRLDIAVIPDAMNLIQVRDFPDLITGFLKRPVWFMLVIQDLFNIRF
ncbi:MAG: hypothetical protein ACE5EH_03180 [Gammaproteobacteria bacterium]